MKPLFLLLALFTTFSAQAIEGRKCRPIGPLHASDPVDRVERCSCEGAALFGGAGFSSMAAMGYQPVDVREWTGAEAPKKVVVPDVKTNFVTLTHTQNLGQTQIETYNYYQSADPVSGGLQNLESEVTVRVRTNSFRQTSCDVIKVESKQQ